MVHRFRNGLHQLAGIGAHGDGSHVHVGISHHQATQVLFCGALTAVGKFGGGAYRRSLGGLSAGVGVHLGIHHEYVDVLTGGHYVIQAAVADVIGPAVAAEEPNHLFAQLVLVQKDVFRQSFGIAGQVRFFQSGNQGAGVRVVGVQVIKGGQPGVDSRFHLCTGNHGQKDLGLKLYLVPALFYRQHHAKAVLRLVFKQRPVESGPPSLFVFGVGQGRECSGPSQGAAHAVDPVGFLTVKLGEKLGIGGFTASGTGSGEFHQGLVELTALKGFAVKHTGFGGEGESVVPVGFVVHGVIRRLHRQSLVLGRAGGGAAAAAGAVQRTDLKPVFQARRAFGVRHGETGGSGLGLLPVYKISPNGGMGADKSALVALETFGGIPIRQAGGDAPFVVLGSSQRVGAVLMVQEGGNRQVVAPLAVAGHHDVFYHVGEALIHRPFVGGRGPRGGDVYFHGAVDAGVNGGHVHANYFFAFFGVGFLNGLFHVPHGVLHRHDAGELEEGGLENHVGVVPQAQLPRDAVGVHNVELDVVVGDVLFHVSRELAVQFRFRPGGVQQERTSVLDLMNHVIAGDVGLGVAGQEVRRLDEVGGADGLLAESKVTFGDAVGFLGVVFKIRLGIHAGVVADDLGGILVGSHGAVGPQAPEFAGNGIRGLSNQGFFHIQTEMGHVVHHADGKELLGVGGVHIVVHRFELGGGYVFRGQTETSAENFRGVFIVGIGGADIQIDGSRDRAGFLGTVHGGDLFHRLRHSAEEILHVKGAEEMNLQQADFFALGPQVVYHLFSGLTGGAHHNDDPLRVLCAVVIENVIVPAGEPVDALHVAFHQGGDGVVGAVVGLLGLIVYIRPLDSGALKGVFRVHGDPVISLQSIPVHQTGHGVQVDRFDLLNFVGGPEAVEEMDEGNPALDGGQVGHGGQVHDLLDAGSGHHGYAGGAAAHDILVVTENVVGVLGHGPGRHMEHGGHPVSGHNVQVRHHQQKSLRGGERGGHGPGLRRSMEGAGSAALRLHFHQGDGLAKHIFPSGGGPFVYLLAHRRGRCDGKNARHIREMVGNMSAGLVAVHRFHDDFIRHGLSSSYGSGPEAAPDRNRLYILIIAP